VLALFALLMAGESVRRFVEPVVISFDEAIVVAVLGLLVNGASVVILRARHGGEHGEHEHDHDHHHHHDHNLRAAHLHVLADALTSVLAIVALVAAKQFGAVWMDPAMGVVGGVLVARWSWRLLRDTGSVLLDRQAPDPVIEAIARAVEADGRFRVVDLHVWSIGRATGRRSSPCGPRRPCDSSEVESLMPDNLGIAHVTVEVRPG